MLGGAGLCALVRQGRNKLKAYAYLTASYLVIDPLRSFGYETLLKGSEIEGSSRGRPGYAQRKQAAEIFGYLSLLTIKRWLKRRHETSGAEPLSRSPSVPRLAQGVLLRE